MKYWQIVEQKHHTSYSKTWVASVGSKESIRKAASCPQNGQLNLQAENLPTKDPTFSTCIITNSSPAWMKSNNGYNQAWAQLRLSTSSISMLRPRAGPLIRCGDACQQACTISNAGLIALQLRVKGLIYWVVLQPFLWGYLAFCRWNCISKWPW